MFFAKSENGESFCWLRAGDVGSDRAQLSGMTDRQSGQGEATGRQRRCRAQRRPIGPSGDAAELRRQVVDPASAMSRYRSIGARRTQRPAACIT